MDKQTELALKRGEYLPLMEGFYTIQGEGFFSGKAAYFLRIGGCDVGCRWCDVKESWNADLHPPTSIVDIIKGIEKYSVDTVVITGGEPLMWNLDKLTLILKEKGLKVHLETSGAYPLSGYFDWICLSPKKMQASLSEIKPLVDELKIIVNNKHDLKWAEEQRKYVKKDCKLYLQSEWSRREQNIPIIIDFVKENIEWSISLQSHKYMNIP
ncbi:MAG: 7-carboxy-7-deazaguanine synthase QueE [Flavobacteriales bacterium]|nr:7-carboxy-7-deazaguanine synthase QueE [Flavobacteriales bacterium]|tara:strand:+ start:51765 stop:52397 length:633 start_codon:yes stop_codon:yes gene_type:complete